MSIRSIHKCRNIYHRFTLDTFTHSNSRNYAFSQLRFELLIEYKIIIKKTQQLDNTIWWLKQDKYWWNFPSAIIEVVSNVIWHTVWSVQTSRKENYYDEYGDNKIPISDWYLFICWKNYYKCTIANVMFKPIQCVIDIWSFTRNHMDDN